MRTDTFQSVLWGVARFAGLDPARDLNAARAGTFTEYINQRLREAWRFDYWPEWTLVEQRAYRDAYSAAENISAGAQRWHAGSQQYYQALRAQTPATEAPATYASATWTENSAYWALLKDSYSDAADWLANTVYAVGDQVRDPLTDLFYQCHTAHTSSTTIDPTKFGALTPFERYVAYEQTGQTAIGEVKRVGYRSPRIFPDRYGPVQYRLTDAGILILPLQPAWITIPQNRTPNLVWLEFRSRPPVFNSTAYSASENIAAGVVRYYSTTGECYVSLLAQSPAAIAPTNTTYWRKLDFPTVLATFVKRAAAADVLRDQKQNDRANDWEDTAREELANTRDQELGSQGQFESAEVCTYGT